LRKDASSEEVKVRNIARCHPANLRHDLAKQHEPQYRLDSAGKQLPRIMVELLHFGRCHSERLGHIFAQRQPNRPFNRRVRGLPALPA
jgi:hypothetical protein